jgi:hypothetical protein
MIQTNQQKISGAENEIMVQIREMKVSVFYYFKFLTYKDNYPIAKLHTISVNFHWKTGTICWHLCRAVNLGMLSPKLGTANSPISSNLFFMMK